MPNALQKKVDEIKEKHGAALARSREKAKQIAMAQRHTLIASAVAYGAGAAEQRGVNLPTIKNVDPKLLYGAGALALAMVVKSPETRRIAQSVGDGLLAICAYNQARGISVLGTGAGTEPT